MPRALVIDIDAANRLSGLGGLPDNWLDVPTSLGEDIQLVDYRGISYLIGSAAEPDYRVLVIAAGARGLFDTLPATARVECFQRVLRAALSSFYPGLIKIPIEWRVFHSGSLVSFQTNRMQMGVVARAYMDVAPEGTNHVYAFHVSHSTSEPLTRANYDPDLFMEVVLGGYEAAFEQRSKPTTTETVAGPGHLTIALTKTFTDANITLGIPFTVWRDTKLTKQQRDFFDTQFDGPLRVKGPAGSGKTLVLTMRFLKEIYAKLDKKCTVRACFLAHAEETARHILHYLMQIDERGVFFGSPDRKDVDLEVTTLHGLADRYINRETENVQPLSLDGSEGRKLQMELIEAITADFVRDDWNEYKAHCRVEFAAAIENVPLKHVDGLAFCYDVSDEFANVLETFGVRNLDDIGSRYMSSRPSERALARNSAEKQTLLELYRRFRRELGDLGVVSLDQFTADFLAYLNSFRWGALRRERGFDFVFADELHLFNAQERRVLGYLLRDPDAAPKVAVAYDPRQSPRNSFFPETKSTRDNIWTEARLGSAKRAFELTDIFRYTPQILSFLARLNTHFPGDDLAEEWNLVFGASQISDGPIPESMEYADQRTMFESALDRARSSAKRRPRTEQTAVLCLDPERFGQYQTAGILKDDFVVVAGRDELGMIGRYSRRAVLSMPEYVAGLQFSTVILVDANAQLVKELGGGINGLHRFISAVYLGASRAKYELSILSDRSAGGFAEPIRDAIRRKLITGT